MQKQKLLPEMIENEIFTVFIIRKKAYLHSENLIIKPFHWHNKSNVTCIVYNYFNTGYLVKSVKLILNFYPVTLVSLYEGYVVKGKRFSSELLQ